MAKRQKRKPAAAPKETSTALAHVQRAQVPGRQQAMSAAIQGLVPQSLGEAFQLATYLAKSEIIPKSLHDHPEAVLGVMMAGIELGLSPLQALNNITIISGKMAIMSNLQLALVRNSGVLAYWDEGYIVNKDDPDKTLGWCEVARRGMTEPDGKTLKIYRREFTVAMAKQVKIEKVEWQDTSSGKRRPVTVGSTTLAEKDNYVNWPERMYPYRARSWVLEAVFGDVLKGLPSVEGVEGGQIIDAEILPETGGDVVDAMMAEIRAADSELATSIEVGFDVLKLATGRRLQKLKEYKDKPRDLGEWLRKEYAARKGKPYEKKSDPVMKNSAQQRFENPLGRDVVVQVGDVVATADVGHHEEHAADERTPDAEKFGKRPAAADDKPLTSDDIFS